MSSVAPALAAPEAKRPAPLLWIYSWDMLRAFFALLAALAAFGGAVNIGGKDVEVPLIGQVISAVSNAAYAASLIIVATVLTRHWRWVRPAQVASLMIAIVLIIASLLAQRITDPAVLLGNAAFVGIDLAAIVLMRRPSVSQWYASPGRIPLYITIPIGFWAAINAAFVLYLALAIQ